MNKPWPYLRQEQGEVLEKWFPRRDDRDIVIKQNTGGGKTVAGLLIAQSTLNERLGPAVYLAPDSYLVERVRQEADRLGLANTSDPDDVGFLAQESILVTTFQRLVNGKSVFGVVGGDRAPRALGIVIVDDAHAALAVTEGQFRLCVPHDHDAYGHLIDLFESDLRAQSHSVWEDVKAKEYGATARIPFWAWSDRIAQVMAVLHPHRLEDDFKFTWPLIADVLGLCAATVTPRQIEIRPPCPPIARIPSFAKARRRVYLTATLSDDSILVTDLDADPSLVARPVTPGSAADLGDRLILAPISLNPRLDDGAVRALAKQFSVGDRDGDGVNEAPPINVVVLVPSNKAAAAWAPIADRVLRVGDLEAGVEDLKAGHVGLVVLVNKYDGVDLPRGACQLLILDGIPQPMDAVERREALALSGSRVRRSRDMQRIEQGMGRGVRDSDDYCAVLLLGADLAAATYDTDSLALFSPATRAQLQLSRDVATQITGKGLDAVREVVAMCLNRDPNWVERSRRAVAEVRYDETGVVRIEAIKGREAFGLAATGQFSDAARSIQDSINATNDEELRGWLMEQKAAYLHFIDKAAAQQSLATAIQLNPYVLRPIAGVSFAAKKPVVVQARAAAVYLKETYEDGMALVLGVRSLLESIQWDEERTDDAEHAWMRLGYHLGFDSTRPEKLYGTGPDNHWVLSDTRHAVIELKTGATTDTIAKKDLDQLGGSVRWDQTVTSGVDSLPVMVHPSNTPQDRGILVDGMRIVTPPKLEELKNAVTNFAVALADGMGRWGDEQAVGEQLIAWKLTAGLVFNTYSEVPKKSG
ncbi:DEAD/DEAH box helicase [Prescottella equi]|uniref:DEAD/DEAH box helicase n=1 Tax=Rhodococcus hoagii TaxID=43767 RepID=UPI001E4FB4A0|nr:DEAD/DEAH box helicase [Prescottella equi]